MTLALAAPIPVQPTASHPTWCQNPADGFSCECADPEYAVIHSRGAHFVSGTDIAGKPVDIAVDLVRVTRHDGLPAQQTTEMVLPGGRADLDRAQLRQLIAELVSIDSLWEA